MRFVIGVSLKYEFFAEYKMYHHKSGAKKRRETLTAAQNLQELRNKHVLLNYYEKKKAPEVTFITEHFIFIFLVFVMPVVLLCKLPFFNLTTNLV